MNAYKRILWNSALNDGGGGATHPLDLAILPEEIRSSPALASIKTIPDLAKSYLNAQQLIGAKRTVIPGDSATKEQWDSFYKDVGRPETPDKYIAPEIKDLDPSLKPDAARMAAVQQKMYELGLTPRQFKGLLEYHLGEMNNQVKGVRTQQQASSDAAIGSLRQEWGDKYDSNLDVARGVLKKFGDESLGQYLDQSGLGNNVALIKLLHKMGGAVMEDHERRGGQGGGLDLNDQTRALQEIDQLKTDESFQKMLGDPRSAGHKAALDRWINLHSVAHPGKSD